MNNFLSSTVLLLILSSCAELTEGEFASEEHYFNLDTLDISNWKIKNIKLDNSINQLGSIGPIVESGSQTLMSRVQYGDSSVRSHRRIVNLFGQSDTVLYFVRVKSIYVGKEFELRFIELNESILIDYCSFIISDYIIQTKFGPLSRRTKLKDIIKLFPSSAKWLNDRAYEPSQFYLEFPEQETASIEPGTWNWLPFSDGNKGTVHLVFLDGQLITIKRNWSDL